ncbi:hypothetical protein D3C75_1021860 [compost metagenome]
MLVGPLGKGDRAVQTPGPRHMGIAWIGRARRLGCVVAGHVYHFKIACLDGSFHIRAECIPLARRRNGCTRAYRIERLDIGEIGSDHRLFGRELRGTEIRPIRVGGLGLAHPVRD